MLALLVAWRLLIAGGSRHSETALRVGVAGRDVAFCEARLGHRLPAVAERRPTSYTRWRPSIEPNVTAGIRILPQIASAKKLLCYTPDGK
jgi:hypothetical protein